MTAIAGPRLLLTPRWIAGHLLALGLIVLFISLGFWQLDRLGQRRALNENIAAQMSAQPLPLSELLARHADSPGQLEYRPALAEGTFDVDSEILLRSKSRMGEAGYHVLTPLVLADGRALLVDRGWVPYRMDEPPIAEAAPASGPVRVEGLLRVEQDPPEGWAASFAPRDPSEGELDNAYYVDVERLAAQMPFELLPVYLVVRSVEPSAPGELPLTPEPPDLEQGSHLSYALQWFSFGLIGMIGYALLLWKTAREK